MSCLKLAAQSWTTHCTALSVMKSLDGKSKTIQYKIAADINGQDITDQTNVYDMLQEYASSMAAVGDDKAVGVVGDERKYGRIVTVRVVDSIDAMTADWTRLPNGVLEKISNRITNEIDEVTWVSYVISSKPPATIEPQ